MGYNGEVQFSEWDRWDILVMYCVYAGTHKME